MVNDVNIKIPDLINEMIRRQYALFTLSCWWLFCSICKLLCRMLWEQKPVRCRIPYLSVAYRTGLQTTSGILVWCPITVCQSSTSFQGKENEYLLVSGVQVQKRTDIGRWYGYRFRLSDCETENFKKFSRMTEKPRINRQQRIVSNLADHIGRAHWSVLTE